MFNKQSSYIRIPDWLYELLPYVYAVSGIVVIAVTPNEWGLFSGFMFLSAAISVFFMRRAYRKARKRVQASEERVFQLETEKTKLGQFKLFWGKEYLSGNSLIDTQHKHIFDACNALMAAVENNQPKIEVEFLLEALITDLSLHFDTEETVITRTGSPIPIEHRQMHSKLLARAEEMLKQYRRGTLEMGDLFGFIGYELVATHIANEAKMFMEHV